MDLRTKGIQVDRFVDRWKPHEQVRKDQLLRNARLFLERIATEVLGLTKGQYDLRVNPAGPAVSGEATLHTDFLYVQISQWPVSNMTVLYRSCKDRKDYTGGHNCWCRCESLASVLVPFATPLAQERGAAV
jgi:hypothetical protein